MQVIISFYAILPSLIMIRCPKTQITMYSFAYGRTETSIVCFIGLHPTKTHLEDGTYYVNELLLTNLFAYYNNVYFNTPMGSSCVWFHQISFRSDRKLKSIACPIGQCLKYAYLQFSYFKIATRSITSS